MAHSLAGDGVGESQFRRGDIHCGTLYTLYTVHILYNIQYMYFVHSRTVLQFLSIFLPRFLVRGLHENMTIFYCSYCKVC
jgi:hypothetical protein